MLRLDITVNGKLESWEEYQPERIATNADILGAARERMRADGWVQTDYRNPDDDTVEILHRRATRPPALRCAGSTRASIIGTRAAAPVRRRGR